MEFEWLKKIPIFSGLSVPQLRRVAAVAVLRNYEPNEVIFYEADPGEGIHFVQSGQVKIIKTADDGREHILTVLGAGEVFAEVLLFQNRPYPATAMTLETSRIGMITNRALEKLVLEEPELALALIKMLNQRLIYVQEKVKSLALNNVLARTAQALLLLSDRPLPSRQDLASLAGTTRESLTRALSMLKQKGLVAEDHKQIMILDEEALKSLIETGRFSE